MAFTLPWGVELTVEDRDAIPDDGHRHELLDGALLVTPAPGMAHQASATSLAAELLAAAGRDHLVLTSPFDYQVNERTVLQPDVLVIRRSDIRARRLVGTPLLVVEIQSPSTRLIDLNLKRAAYATAGVPSYWL
ncbi:MAG: Uma2 family endonuclease, partial [Acidimicrobiales bacterium]